MAETNTNKKIFDVVWPENRDVNFINLLAADISRLQEAGFSDKEIKKMIGTLNYVRIWCKNPVWLHPVKSLPKGYKWADGTKFKLKGVKRRGVENYTFLIIDDDLYIRGTYAVGMNIKDKPMVKIINFRNLSANDAVSGLGGSPFFEDSVLKFWKENELKLGLVVSYLKEVN